jgi:hypothetical protein
MLFDDDNWKLIHQSLPPLRWLANGFGNIGSWAILRCAFAEEDERMFAAKIYGKIYSLFMPLSNKYGSYYKLDRQIEEDL